MGLTPAEMHEQSRTADVGELAGPLAHEFNDFLNCLLLQVAVLEQQLPADRRGDLAALRRQGSRVAALVKRFQHYRRTPPANLQAIDVNAIVANAVQALVEEPLDGLRFHPVSAGATLPSETENPGAEVVIPLTVDLQAQPGRALGRAADLARTCRFLLMTAARINPASGVHVRTRQESKSVLLLMENTAAENAAAEVLRLFDSGSAVGNHECALQVAACKSLVRRMQGNLRAEPRPARGFTIAVELPVA